MLDSVKFKDLLSGFESDLVVLPPVAGINLGKVESLGEEVVDQGAECHSVLPSRCEVVDFDVLKENDEKYCQGWHLNFRHQSSEWVI